MRSKDIKVGGEYAHNDSLNRHRETLDWDGRPGSSRVVVLEVGVARTVWGSSWSKRTVKDGVKVLVYSVNRPIEPYERVVAPVTLREEWAPYMERVERVKAMQSRARAEKAAQDAQMQKRLVAVGHAPEFPYWVRPMHQDYYLRALEAAFAAGADTGFL